MSAIGRTSTNSKLVVACVLSAGLQAGCGELSQESDSEFTTAEFEIGVGPDFSGNSVKITGSTTPVDDKIPCADMVGVCVNFNAEGKVALLNLCPGTWTFSFDVFAGQNCTGGEVPGLTCPDAGPEVLPPGMTVLNEVICTTDGFSGKQFDFDVEPGDSPTCEPGFLCVDNPQPGAVSGQATAISVAAPLVTSDFGSTAGPLPPSGGSDTATVADLAATALVPGLTVVTLDASALAAETESPPVPADGFAVTSTASTAGLSLAMVDMLLALPLTNLVSAPLITSKAQARCDAVNDAFVTGETCVTSLVIDGLPAVTACPAASSSTTLTIALPLIGVIATATVAVNEQIINDVGGYAAITVNGLHVTVDLAATALSPDIDLVVAQSHADINCDP